MKKILLVTRPISPPWDEASKNFAYFLAKESKDSEFHVLTPGNIFMLEPHIRQEPIYTATHLDWIQRTKLLKLLTLSRKFDVLHFMLTPNTLNSLAFRTATMLSKAKTIQTVATLREDLFSDNEIKRSLFADKIITYSDYAKNKLEKMGFSNVDRIYPGIDLEKYSPAPKNQETLSRFRLSASDFIIMYPGEYVRLGATDHIVEFLPELFSKIPTAKFVFGCRIKNEADRKKKEEITEKFKEKGILHKIVFTDTFADMPRLYNISDVVVFPVMDMKGKFDVPLAVIEAFACEKPVIISDIPVLQEFANDQNSIIIKTGDKGSLLSSIEKLHADENLRRELGKKARQYAEKDFDITQVVSQYEKTYNQLFKKN